MSPRWRKNKIKRVDEDTWSVRINEHVLVEYTRDKAEDGTYSFDVYVLNTMGPYIIQSFIQGSSDWELDDWQLVDVTITGQMSIGDDEFLDIDVPNIDLSLEYVPDIRTWIKMAAEKGAF